MRLDAVSKGCIALIDDDDSIRRAVGRLLRVNGYVCETYDSLESALASPKFSLVNCAVVDIQLNGMNGFDILGRFETLGKTMPCIFITAFMERDLPERRGKHSLLIKPFEESELIASIERALTI